MLRQSNCVKEISGLSTGTITAAAGKSILIRQFSAPFPTSTGYVTLKVDRKTVGVYRFGGKTGNHIGMPLPGYHHRNLWDELVKAGINLSIPVAEGQSFTYTYSSGNAHTVIIYDIYDAGDITSIMQNGSDAKDYTFLQYMDAASYPSASGDVHLDTALSPAEFPNFPCDAVVPSGHTIKLLALVGSPVGDATDASNYIVTDYLKLIRGREMLLDEDNRGIPFRNGGLGAAQVEYTDNVSMIHACVPSAISTGKPTDGGPLIFDPPLEFASGDEFGLYLVFRLVGSHTLTAAAIDIAAVLNVVVV